MPRVFLISMEKDRKLTLAGVTYKALEAVNHGDSIDLYTYTPRKEQKTLEYRPQGDGLSEDVEITLADIGSVELPFKIMVEDESGTHIYELDHIE